VCDGDLVHVGVLVDLSLLHALVATLTNGFERLAKAKTPDLDDRREIEREKIVCPFAILANWLTQSVVLPWGISVH
jgi:hypothetical protein